MTTYYRMLTLNDQKIKKSFLSILDFKESYGLDHFSLQLSSMPFSITMIFGRLHSIFGDLFIAVKDYAICKLCFFDSTEQYQQLITELKNDWREDFIVEHQEKILDFIRGIYSKTPLNLLLKGTSFQLKVWHALLAIPAGFVATYTMIANAIGLPTAVRPAASAIAKNQIALLIPCHRVILKNGDFGQYRWHHTRKQQLIAWESNYQWEKFNRGINERSD